MIRAFLTIILPLLLPTALYLLWAMTMRRAEAAGVVEILRGLPWLWLGVAGLALLAGVLVLVALGFGRSADTARYVPPRTVNGKIVPGHIEPAPASQP
jgi:phosphoglycerol transferase MdoB-like AlkP superfamily enzyme